MRTVTPERPESAVQVLRALRETRLRRRLGDTEWFDVAYRVYLFALVGFVAVVAVSDAVRGLLPESIDEADLLARGPALIGMLAAAAFAVGVRSGADGGPVAVEAGDVRHLLLAPVRRRTVLLRPTVQRFRSVAFAAGLSAAAIAQFVAIDLVGSRAAWAAAGLLFGAVVGAMYVAIAVLAHAARLPRPAATVLALAVLGWQGVAALQAWYDDSVIPGPTTTLGRLALWGVDVRPVDIIAVVAVTGLAVAALAGCGGLRIEQLVRRADLVSQLRFAATAQDLRTVVLLRRELRAEAMRRRPWGDRRRSMHDRIDRAQADIEASTRRRAIRRRGWASLRRLPAARVGRIVALSALGGVAAGLAVAEAPLYAMITAAALFLVGLDLIEALSQEVDHPDLTAGLDVEPGWLMAHHLVVPAVALGVCGAIGGLSVAFVDPSWVPAAIVLGAAMANAAAAGPVVAALGDVQRPLAIRTTTITASPREEISLAPPEFAGFSTALRVVTPIALSALAVVPLLAVRADPGFQTVARSIVGCALFAAALVVWIVRRDGWGLAIRRFFARGRATA